MNKIDPEILNEWVKVEIASDKAWLVAGIIFLIVSAILLKLSFYYKKKHKEADYDLKCYDEISQLLLFIFCILMLMSVIAICCSSYNIYMISKYPFGMFIRSITSN